MPSAMNPDTYDIYRQWWRDRYGYDCPIPRAAFDRYLATDHPRAVYDETFSPDEWADRELRS